MILFQVPTNVTDLADLIAFNTAHAAEELPAPFWTDQSEFVQNPKTLPVPSLIFSFAFYYRFITCENTTMDAAYFAALDADHDLGRTRGIDATLQMFGLDAILLPTDGRYTFLSYNSPLVLTSIRLHCWTSRYCRIPNRHRYVQSPPSSL